MQEMTSTADDGNNKAFNYFLAHQGDSKLPNSIRKKVVRRFGKRKAY